MAAASEAGAPACARAGLSLLARPPAAGSHADSLDAHEPEAILGRLALDLPAQFDRLLAPLQELIHRARLVWQPCSDRTEANRAPSSSRSSSTANPRAT